MLPIKGGSVNKNELVDNYNNNIHYGLEWLNNSLKYFTAGTILNDTIYINKK